MKVDLLVGSRQGWMMGSVAKELDEDQAAVLAEAQPKGMVVKEASLTQCSCTCELARAALENMLLYGASCWLGTWDEHREKVY